MGQEKYVRILKFILCAGLYPSCRNSNKMGSKWALIKKNSWENYKLPPHLPYAYVIQFSTRREREKKNNRGMCELMIINTLQCAQCNMSMCEYGVPNLTNDSKVRTSFFNFFFCFVFNLFHSLLSITFVITQ